MHNGSKAFVAYWAVLSYFSPKPSLGFSLARAPSLFIFFLCLSPTTKSLKRASMLPKSGFYADCSSQIKWDWTRALNMLRIVDRGSKGGLQFRRRFFLQSLSMCVCTWLLLNIKLQCNSVSQLVINLLIRNECQVGVTVRWLCLRNILNWCLKSVDMMSASLPLSFDWKPRG